jgi:hypothetical protein
MSENRIATALIHINNVLDILKSAAIKYNRSDIGPSEWKDYREHYSADPEDMLSDRKDLIKEVVQQVNTQGWRKVTKPMPKGYTKWDTEYLCPVHAPDAVQYGVITRPLSYEDAEPNDLEIVTDSSFVLIECMKCDALVEKRLPEVDVTLEYIGGPDEDDWRERHQRNDDDY